MRESIFDRGPRLRTEAFVANLASCGPRQTAARIAARLANRCVGRARALSRFVVMHSSEQPPGPSTFRTPMRERRRTKPAHPKNSCVCVRMIGWKQKSAQL
jgi:hypothetical protein